MRRPSALDLHAFLPAPHRPAAWSEARAAQGATMPMTMDLSDPEALDGPWPGEAAVPVPAMASAYDACVLVLRAGDRVAVDGAAFRLGAFLGAGNASHVWRLSDRPDTVLRLPLLAGHLTEAAGSRRERIRDAMQVMVDTRDLARLAPRCAILPEVSDPRGRFALAQYVPGSLTADRFVAEAPPETQAQGCAAAQWADLRAMSRALEARLGEPAEGLLKQLLWREAPPQAWVLIDPL